MKTKKILPVILAATMAMSTLAGCGSSKEAADASNNSGEAVQIDFWYAGGKTAVNVLQGIVDEFNASQDEYYINTVTQADYTETYEKLQAVIAGGNAPDMALLNVSNAEYLYSKG